MIPFQPSRSFAESMDRQDPLAAYRSRFFHPIQETGEPYVYLVGHSLGLQPRTVRAYVEQELLDWEKLGVEGHFKGQNPWLSYHEYLTRQLADLVGARPSEVVAMNSLTVNLHLMMVSFYRPTPSRYKILIEGSAFPSDQYAVASQVRFHGHNPDTGIIALKPRDGEDAIRTEDIEALLDREGDTIALVLLGGVNYLTGQVFDMARITQAGHAAGCVVGFDLAHAIGNIELALHDWDVDFAVWCSYKYLNGGPGCVGGCFVHDRHAENDDIPRFAGWWGQDKTTRFKMPSDFTPIPGVEGWQLSNPPILPLAALRASLDLFEEVGMKRLRNRSLSLTGYLEYLLNHHAHDNFALVTPQNPEHRGCMLSIRIHRNGAAAHEILTQRGILCDWREPDIIRAAPTPLYNSYSDILEFAEVFTEANRTAG